jgi:hypothetical protein
MRRKARALLLAGAILPIAASAALGAQAQTDFAPAQRLSPDEAGAGFSEPALAGAPDGSSVAAWVRRSDGATTVQASWISEDGTRGPVIDLSSEPAARLDVAVIDGGPAVVTWSSSREIRFATVTRDGSVGPARTLGAGYPATLEASLNRAYVAWASTDGDRVFSATLQGAEAKLVRRDGVAVGRDFADRQVAVDPGQVPSVLFIRHRAGAKIHSAVLRAKLEPSGRLAKPRVLMTQERSKRTYFHDLDADTDSMTVAVKRKSGNAPSSIVYADLWPEVTVKTVAARRSTERRDVQLVDPDVENHPNGSATVAWTTEIHKGGGPTRWIAASKVKKSKATRPEVLSSRNVDARSPVVETVIAGATVAWRSDRGVQWSTLPGGPRGQGQASKPRTVPGTSGLEIRELSLAETGPNIFAAWAQTTGGPGAIAGSVGTRGD